MSRFLSTSAMSSGVLLAATFLLAPAAPVPPEADRPRYFFPTTVGTKWVYFHEGPRVEITDVVTKVTKKDGTTTVTVARYFEGVEDEDKEEVLVSDKGVFLATWYSCRCDPPICWLKTPFKVGQAWTFRTELVTQVMPSDRSGTMKVTAVEKVEVPAGVFEAVRVEAKGTDLGPWTETRWYAPGVGVVKRITRAKDEVVLKSFTPGNER